MPLSLRVLVQNPLCSGLREPPGPVIFIMPANSLLDGKDTPPALDRHEAGTVLSCYFFALCTGTVDAVPYHPRECTGVCGVCGHNLVSGFCFQKFAAVLPSLTGGAHFSCRRLLHVLTSALLKTFHDQVLTAPCFDCTA